MQLEKTNTGIARFKNVELPHLPKGYKFNPEGLDKRQLYKYTKKLKECKKSEISTLLRYLYSLTSLSKSNYPNDLEESALIQAIISKFGNNSVFEIKQAFLDAMGNAFEVETNPFGKFSFDYFSKILNSYNEWLIRTRKIKPLELEEPELSEAEIIERNLKALKSNCKHVFEELNKGVEAGKIFIQPSLYNILKDNGLIQTKKWPKVEGYKSWPEQCSNEYLKLNPKKEIYEPITAEGARNDGMKMAVIYTIQAMIKEKANSEILEIIDGLKWIK